MFHILGRLVFTSSFSRRSSPGLRTGSTRFGSCCCERGLLNVGRVMPEGSTVYTCTAIGYSDNAIESWFDYDGLTIECVGIPRYPGSLHPRVGGLLRFQSNAASRQAMKVVLGNVLDPRSPGNKVICQLVNDQARTWGGGV